MEVFGLNLESIFVDLAHRCQVKNCIEGVRVGNIKSGYWMFALMWYLSECTLLNETCEWLVELLRWEYFFLYNR